MILIGALLLLTIAGIGLGASDLRLINRLRQQRVSASAMPALQTLLDRAPTAGLATENAALSQRLHQLEKKLELLETEPRTLPPPSEIRATKINGVPSANCTGGSGEQSPEASLHGCPRLSITAEEILFLTGEFSDSLEATPARAILIPEAGAKRFQAYFPANGNLIEHASTPSELADYVRSAVIRGLRLEGFAINSEPAADDFLAKLITGGNCTLHPSRLRDLRNVLARELMTYVAAHPLRKVRGRGEARRGARVVPSSTLLPMEPTPLLVSTHPQHDSSTLSVLPSTPRVRRSTLSPHPAAPSSLPAPKSSRPSSRSTRRPAPSLLPSALSVAPNAPASTASAMPDPSAPPAPSSSEPRTKRGSIPARKKKGKPA